MAVAPAAAQPMEAPRRRMLADTEGNTHAAMGDALHMLKLLDYENRFCARRGLQPLSAHYFAVPGKPSEQFPYFSALVLWLLKEVLGVNVVEWREFEDPNSISNSVLMEAKKLGFPHDFPVAKLRHGNGDAVCAVLVFMLQQALAKARVELRPPVYGAGGGDDDEAAEEVQTEALEEEDEDDAPAEPADEDAAEQAYQPAVASAEGKAPAEAKVDAAAWLLELERVGPKLRPRGQAPAKEWRTHLEQSLKHRQLLAEQFPASKGTLARLGEQLRKALDRLAAKEQHIHKEFEQLGGDFRTKQAALADAQAQYQGLSTAVAELTQDLQTKSEAIELIKAQMQDRNNSMIDTSPLRRLQQALADLRAEVAAIDLRIGVVSQTLMQATTRGAGGAAPSTAGTRRAGSAGLAAGEDEPASDEDALDE